MPPTNRCLSECPVPIAERAICRHDQLQPHDTMRLIALGRLNIMRAVHAAHATFRCPERSNTDNWQPNEACGRRAGAILASRQFAWGKLSEQEQNALSPYWPR